MSRSTIEPVFFPGAGTVTLEEVASLAGLPVPEGSDPKAAFGSVAPLETAGPDQIAYMDNPGYVDALKSTGAGICLVGTRFAAHVPAGTVALVLRDPQRVYALVAARLYPSAMRPASVFGATGISPGSFVHPTARLEPGVTVDPGAVIGPGAEIGSGSVICGQAVIGPQVRVGRDCAIGPNVSVLNALLGNRVILHPGVRIGQDGFGYVMGPKGHQKVAQIGRVIIQDDVEIGSNTTVDRGANRDTVIGEGTKIDNLVQIAHNVVIGRHCVIVAECGISGSSTLEDFVVLGAKVGMVGHVRVGRGSQIAASSNITHDVPPGSRYGGTPAKPVREWFREIATLKRLASRGVVAKDDGTQGGA